MTAEVLENEAAALVLENLENLAFGEVVQTATDVLELLSLFAHADASSPSGFSSTSWPQTILRSRM